MDNEQLAFHMPRIVIFIIDQLLIFTGATPIIFAVYMLRNHL